MIIRVPQQNVIPLLRNSGKDGLFLRQIQRANQGLKQTESVGLELEKTSRFGCQRSTCWWMRSERVRLARIHGTRMEVVTGQASRTGRQSRPARKRFHHQDERFNDSNRGVRSTWDIGPIPYSTTPLQLSDAFWTGSGGVGTPWKVIPLRVLPIKEGR